MIHPLDTATWGINKGYQYWQIYKYCPDYLEWAIKYIADFVLIPSEFESLPNPTPVKQFINEYNSFIMLKYEGLGIQQFGEFMRRKIDITRSTVGTGVILEEIGFVLDEIQFTFSEESIQILNDKERGIYEVPTPPNREETDTSNW